MHVRDAKEPKSVGVDGKQGRSPPPSYRPQNQRERGGEGPLAHPSIYMRASPGPSLRYTATLRPRITAVTGGQIGNESSGFVGPKGETRGGVRGKGSVVQTFYGDSATVFAFTQSSTLKARFEMASGIFEPRKASLTPATKQVMRTRHGDTILHVPKFGVAAVNLRPKLLLACFGRV